MKQDLYLSPSLTSFEDLSELLGTIDDLVDTYRQEIAKYEDKLGQILRGTGGGEARQNLMRFDSETGSQELRNPEDVQVRLDRRRRTSSDGREEGWLVLDAEETNLRVATGGANSAAGKQSEALFKVIESLKAKLASLEKVQRLIGSLPSQGFKPNQKILVLFRDGIPKQIIPANEASKTYKKFKYSEQFDIQVLA